MNALKRTWNFMQPYNLIFFLMVVTVILPVLMELTVPRALRYVIDSGIAMNDMDAIFRGVGVMLLAAVLGAIATLGQGVFRARLSQGLAYDMREVLFAHIQSFSFANLDTMQTGELMTRMTSDVRMVRMFMSAGLALLLRALLMIVGSVTMMVLLDWQLALIMLVVLPIAGVVIAVVMVPTRPMFTVVQEKLGVLNSIVQENLSGVQVVKAFVRERYEIERFSTFNVLYRDETYLEQLVFN